jgi:hypothetical protein
MLQRHMDIANALSGTRASAAASILVLVLITSPTGAGRVDV